MSKDTVRNGKHNLKQTGSYVVNKDGSKNADKKNLETEINNDGKVISVVNNNKADTRDITKTKDKIVSDTIFDPTVNVDVIGAIDTDVIAPTTLEQHRVTIFTYDNSMLFNKLPKPSGDASYIGMAPVGRKEEDDSALSLTFDVEFLKQCITTGGRLLSRVSTGVSRKMQKKIKYQVNILRNLGIFPSGT